ncbi:MAG TPA: 6-hydroxymethylpterin diphosphokinase MptE-like protein, partial [Nannocystaceae bacterium]|nr:6-hydroxymethylpterin diphosphokinase MptE-like protein [Nannocystaceae bacterium]
VDLAALANVPAGARSLARTVERIHLEQAEARRHGPQLRANLEANVEALIGATSLHACTGVAAGRPGFVLAAGPSAAAAMSWLGDARRHGPIVAVDTALPLCRSAGIPVDCLVAVDPHPASAVHLSHGVADVGALAFQPYCAPAIVDAFPSRVLALPRGDRLCDRAARLMDLPSVPVAGTVLLYALQVAAVLGCDPIVIVGADFAHVGGHSHAIGTATSRELAPTGLVVADAHGQPVPTSHALLRFLAEVERHIAATRAHHVVVDGGGAAIAGARRASPTAIARWLAMRAPAARAPFVVPAVGSAAIPLRRRVWSTLLGQFD